MIRHIPSVLNRILLAVSLAASAAVFALLWSTGQTAVFSAGWSILLGVGLAVATRLSYQRVCSPLISHLFENEAKYRTILDTTVDAIITIDSVGIIQSVNRATVRLLGYEAEEIIGCNVNILMPQPEQGKHDAYLERYLQGGDPRIIGIGREVRALKKDGSQVPVDLAVSEFQLGGERMFTGVLRDVSERKRLEEQLTRSSKLASLGELVGGIAHEVNTPTGIIVMRSSGLLRVQDGLPEDAREDVEVIERQAHKIAQITSGLLAFSRQAPFDPRPSCEYGCREEPGVDRKYAQESGYFPHLRTR